MCTRMCVHASLNVKTICTSIHVLRRTQFLQLMGLARMSSIIRILRNALKTKNREAETAGQELLFESHHSLGEFAKDTKSFTLIRIRNVEQGPV